MWAWQATCIHYLSCANQPHMPITNINTLIYCTTHKSVYIQFSLCTNLPPYTFTTSSYSQYYIKYSFQHTVSPACRAVQFIFQKTLESNSVAFHKLLNGPHLRCYEDFGASLERAKNRAVHPSSNKQAC